MSPVNNAMDAVWSVMLPGVFRFVSLFYLFAWDSIVYDYFKKINQGATINTPKEDKRSVVGGQDNVTTDTDNSTNDNNNGRSRMTRSAMKTKKDS